MIDIFLEKIFRDFFVTNYIVTNDDKKVAKNRRNFLLQLLSL